MQDATVYVKVFGVALAAQRLQWWFFRGCIVLMLIDFLPHSFQERFIQILLGSWVIEREVLQHHFFLPASCCFASALQIWLDGWVNAATCCSGERRGSGTTVSRSLEDAAIYGVVPWCFATLLWQSQLSGCAKVAVMSVGFSFSFLAIFFLQAAALFCKITL